MPYKKHHRGNKQWLASCHFDFLDEQYEPGHFQSEYLQSKEKAETILERKERINSMCLTSRPASSWASFKWRISPDIFRTTEIRLEIPRISAALP